MSGRRTSSRLKALTRSSLKSLEKSTKKFPAKPTPYSRPRRKCASKDPKKKANTKPADTKHQKTSNSNKGKGKPSIKTSPDVPPIQPIIVPGRSELVEIIENTPGCQSGSELMLDVLVMTLEGATVMLTSDKENKSVNALYREGGEERTSILPTSQFLTNFTIIEDNLVAAGVWYQYQIIFFKVFPDLDLQRTIDTKTRYSSIAFLSPGTLVGSHVLGNCGVDVIDMSGNILRTFDRSHFSRPYSVCTYNGNCIVGDMTNHAIMCFNDMGNMLFNFKPGAEKKFVGLLTVRAHKGYIYASDREGHRVVQLTADGKFVRDVLTREDGIEEPQGICITDDNLLYVSVINSYIRVYRIG
ncbi:E3 ubiquitin-protein ligase TRIM56-like [Haliotis rubra]|uniref:E3 ubiquitin-protein ligase TRIM56-like n=1 Tax=Haliotis rubra TaxID=36100 RepID=UPI001EE58C49|nr:E3 ubiquitin-protein ligase TRIM56-like [Haliotis rubra]